MKILCRGHSVIADALAKIENPDAWPRGGEGDPDGQDYIEVEHLRRGKLPPPGDNNHRLLICQGLQVQKKVFDQTTAEMSDALAVNMQEVIQLCDYQLGLDARARICVIGSEAAYTGSHNMAYSASKAAIHHYVEYRRVSKQQQLVCIAPTMIVPSGMHDRRNADGITASIDRMQKHPKKRWLKPIEVARMVHFLLCVDEGYTTNVVIRMNGGSHAGLK